MKIKTAVLTISTRASRGKRRDTSGDAIKEIIKRIDGGVVDYRIIPDDQKQIQWELKRMAEVVKADLILTTGGTGLSPTDVTPEATLSIIERRVPGFEEAMRMTGFKNTPHALLSRAVAGTLEKSLIINLPGSPKGVRENLEAILPAIPHGIKILKGTQVADSEHRFKNRDAR
ncbi:MogA/MoaB family molybdenum cofactor biosynthesis protein [candidate division KSB1 bacterium]|nr:MogA/MoaB family molybdenum cofactor biosynthesis protein [candidate division KSB1 bacterium]NIR73194.1 MogA/MoaB family molybdenum cofactor biosynthesis protein [candidate division KSB1 bacterium]NIS28343.1 MogA/MoaB family molybdenum cofactor biosynthesis protein [candidate division KSB1 bacterium]NIT75235.1 MogA/MoaB family molybdenum cofactor biosynthesis protein [candidate division KSB1 bacterium]NIU29075.1 MogA/MoaB family molybdenum cofactor biosynthesis protein [candidate division KS